MGRHGAIPEVNCPAHEPRGIMPAAVRLKSVAPSTEPRGGQVGAHAPRRPIRPTNHDAARHRHRSWSRRIVVGLAPGFNLGTLATMPRHSHQSSPTNGVRRAAPLPGHLPVLRRGRPMCLPCPSVNPVRVPTPCFDVVSSRGRDEADIPDLPFQSHPFPHRQPVFSRFRGCRPGPSASGNARPDAPPSHHRALVASPQDSAR